jgi:hypothetical protein
MIGRSRFTTSAKRNPSLRSRLALAMVVAAGIAAGISTVTAALPSEEFKCLNCASVSGANEYPIDVVHSRNESGTGLCSILWRYNGGTSYTKVAENCTSSGTEVGAAYYAGSYTAHGETERWYAKYEYKMSGYQYHE